ncbi:bifunctional 5,10-methylenetetrahydrofolate dehydrogenase/5,10-methenyltetrahydrofolate cyclohydrolase [Erysipelothrix sp. HDW6B]|uniref:bifunctional 5,10-methylenetetrahydrofolate dehydrogenase/5,10-methenyltetrahydrofolate cyclohydrolase n=1 Tax=Erysipelothrix sp. HDW6B TaxID=2714929 RepID=UPI00140B3A58|nr:bifunctional 5,10-methylenetetrahydrofolate dehydrogenase/5,10-methenyltetrahydrofolate cyclohydrolase [Erysipelothrix sp. HDW6B]QIK85154.1 bifunctional 5,10-methylenetetrahydrofolate dehydrogenase/5,10-methenyltetrahydrofolate cyclohydrolase [Erysipelothrix sp. HDW6B]
MSTRLDGLHVSKEIRKQIAQEVSEITMQGNRAPSLTVVLVGNDPASETYVNSKMKQASAVGMTSKTIRLEEDTSEDDVLRHIHALNDDADVDGILVQLPLPKHINEDIIVDAISPSKDVDGLHPLNVGLLEINRPQFISCTPKGIIRLLDWYHIDVTGKRALVIGRSRLVGKPVATLLTHANATVTLAHSRTQNLDTLIQESDIVVVAIGQPNFIKASQVQSHQVLVDVGIHRIDGKIVGDVDPEAYKKVAYATPVPKGVGPMTIASLLENTLQAYRAHHAQK